MGLSDGSTALPVVALASGRPPSRSSYASRPLNRESPIPLYYQLQEILKQEIEGGVWPPGSTIPSEAELSKTYSISRAVIRKALDILEGDGQVRRVRGVGTIVAEPKTWYRSEAQAKAFLSDSKLESASISRILESSRVPVSRHIGQLLELPESASVFFVACVQSVNGQPAALSQVFIRPDGSERLETLGEQVIMLRPDGGDVIGQLRSEYELEAEQSEIIVEATSSNEYEADLLDIPVGVPVFLLTSLSFSRKGSPVAFSRLIARADTFRFAVKIEES